MKILVIGKTAREHAFIEKISNSPRITELFCVPGNPAIAEYATCVNIALDDIEAMASFAAEHQIDLTVALDEYVIAKGIADIFEQYNLKIFAPKISSAQIALSRVFAKKFMYKNKIPSSKYGIFDKETSAIDYARKSSYPLLIKYDTLEEQDTYFCETFNEAKKYIQKAFSDAQKQIVIEDYIEGDEITFTILTDGFNVLPFPFVKLYKRALEGDGGAITKGVGAYIPPNKINLHIEEIIAKKIVFPLLDTMQEESIAYEGFLSINFVITPKNEVKALEFSPAFNILEAVSVLPLVEDDLIDIIYASISGALGDEYSSLNITDDTVVSVGLLSGNYPFNHKENTMIEGIEDIDEDEVEVYYNNTAMNSSYELVTAGGLPVILRGTGSTVNNARERVYNCIDTITFPEIRYRKDIAKFNISKDF
ncbi:MAG: phosphoribosylamine--glycine ligase [Candidatus Gastranaerophilales bacterium]|nr:phosphoribosylamine--glycine ligase [Candidatus Gastranaerophilales bacterium]